MNLNANVGWEHKISFAACCDFFENLTKNIGGPRDGIKSKRINKLQKFLNQLREIANNHENISNTATNDGNDLKIEQTTQITSLFPILRLILPQLDRERSSYGIKETLLAKLFIGLLQLGPNSEDAIKLKNYKAPKSSKGGPGDFASVLYSVVKDREYGKKDTCPNVADINSSLDEIPIVSATKGRAGPDGVEGILMGLFKRMTAIQVKWLVRIILKDMHIGLGEKTILNTFHLDAQEFYDVNANLRKVAEVLRDPNIRRHEIDITLFDPFRPMLAERGSADMEKVVGKQITSSDFYIETKYDGERIQIHKDSGNKYRYFSRNGNDFTDDFGETPSSLSASGSSKFCSFIHEALAGKVTSVILDGEICAYNKLTDSVTQKGEHMSIRGINSDDPVYQQCLFLYDILLLDGKVLTNVPLHQRLEKLQSIIPKIVHGRVHLANRQVASSALELTNALNKAIDNREEGIMVKDPNGMYRPNARGGQGGWLKIKPEYNNELSDSLDLIVLGGYYGSHSRGRSSAGNISSSPVTHFLLGLIDSSDKDKTIGNLCFHSFCRVGSGYSNKELFDLLQRLQPFFCPWTKEKKQQKKIYDSGIRCKKEPTPDVWIDPSKSVVLQVKAAEIVSSDIYSAGFTLRFPRVINVRDDKSSSDCTSMQEVISLNNETGGKLARRQNIILNGDDLTKELSDNEVPSDSNLKNNFHYYGYKRRIGKGGSPSKRKKLDVPSSYKTADITDVVAASSALDGKVIVIEPTSNPKYKDLKSKLEKIVVKHGGKIEQNVAPGKTYCYIETAGTARAKYIINSGMYDVVRSQWLIDCEHKFRLFGPADMIFATEATEQNLQESGLYDQFGDCYVERITKSSLHYALTNSAMKTSSKYERENVSDKQITQQQIALLEDEYFPKNWKYGLFRHVVAYFDKYQEFGDKETEFENCNRLDLAELKLQFYGGTTVDVLKRNNESELTHVITSEGDVSRLDKIKEFRKSLPQGRKFRIVCDKWVNDCLSEEKIVFETEYEM